MSHMIEVSEPVFNALNQQANTRNSNLNTILERLLALAPFLLPTTEEPSDKEDLQSEIIKLYSTDLEYQDLLGLKQILADFFARKSIEEANTIWDQQAYSDDLMDAWLNEK